MPSFPALVPAVEIFRDTQVAVGAQDLYHEDRGAFTGEVSGRMLAELGCRYVEVGHAERRERFRENEETVALKVGAAIRNRLCPVICVGEARRATAAEGGREAARQLASAMSRIESGQRAAAVVVAYEPAWAIGAEKPAPEGHIAQVCAALKQALHAARPRTTDRVVYGGSAGPGLLERLQDSVDGLFLGRFVHDAAALEEVLQEAAGVSN
jgi:triosephosphate isomerase